MLVLEVNNLPHNGALSAKIPVDPIYLRARLISPS